MTQTFNNHRLAGPMAVSAHADFLGVATDYFGYVALVSTATVIVILSLGLSANVAVGFLDRIVKPAFLTTAILVAPALADKPPGVWRTSTRTE